MLFSVDDLKECNYIADMAIIKQLIVIVSLFIVQIYNIISFLNIGVSYNDMQLPILILAQWIHYRHYK